MMFRWHIAVSALHPLSLEDSDRSHGGQDSAARAAVLAALNNPMWRDSPHPINGLAQGYKINGGAGELGRYAVPPMIAAATCQLHLPARAGKGSVITGISTNIVV
jgi:hypothetical protein